MKRKLFTLLLAFVALATFQVNAAGPYWIKADTTGLNPDPAKVPMYSANKTLLENWLIYTGVKTAGINTGANFFSDYGINQFTVTPVGANLNLMNFKSTKTDAGNLTLSYGSNDWTQFEVVQFDGATGSSKFGFYRKTQSLSDNMEGYLVPAQGGAGINQVDTTSSMLMVLADKDGKLLIKRFDEWATFNALTSEYEYTTNAINNQWRPVYIKLEKVGGRWATAEDFADCKYLSLLGNGTYGKLAAATPGKATENVFAVEQIDYRGFDIGSDDSIIDRGGLQHEDKVNTPNDYILPLFTLSAPGDNCKVLSISKQNKLSIQTEGDNGFADALELRAWGYEYYYRAATGETPEQAKDNYTKNIVKQTVDQTGTSRESDAKSLQKFGIWINDDNTFTIYPEAAYNFKYGEDKWDKEDVVRNYAIDENYNPDHTTEIPVAQTHSFQIGFWNGTGGTSSVTGYTGVIPANLQTYTAYNRIKYTSDCGAYDKIEEKRFYFLEVVAPDTAKAWDGSAERFAAFGPGGYQSNSNREYVLATRTISSSQKVLEIVPKEKVGTNPNDNYWNNTPYDSVNMAAHWEVSDLGNNEYIFVNQLRDTLQFNPSAGAVLSGGWLTQKTITGVFGLEETLDETLLGGRAYDADYFDENTVTTKISAVPTIKTWKANKLSTGFNGLTGVFYLEAADGIKGTTLNQDATWGLADEIAGTTPRDLGYGSGATAKSYYHKNVGLTEPKIYPQSLILGTSGTKPNCSGLLLKLSEIAYVPTYSSSYGTEANNDIINTNDSEFYHNGVGQDSLTAYLLLDGFYDVKEAAKVSNALVLGPKPITGSSVLGASFVPATGQANIQFIPLRNSTIKAKLLQVANDLTTTAAQKDSVLRDYLYGETYKWNIVRDGEGRYLVFDTLSLNGTNEVKQGFVFKKVDEINATPIRLYQPLVGDVINGNFIIQFYPAIYNYGLKAGSKTEYEIKPGYVENITTPYHSRIYVGTPGVNGQLSYGYLGGGQSDYILGSPNVQIATRFNYIFTTPVENCIERFIAPDWLAARKLLGLPLENDVYKQKTAVAHIADNANVATIDASKTTDLKFTYIGKIKPNAAGAAGYLESYTDSIRTGGATLASFVGDVEVPLYFVQNSDGEYLTVSKTTDQYNQFATYDDVTGVILTWEKLAPKYDSKQPYDYRALQVFAISGCGLDTAGLKSDFGKFVLLPLASYKVDYTKQEVINGHTGDLYYNLQLGAGIPRTQQNNITKAYRIGQYSDVAKSVQKLIVSNASASDETSNIAIEFGVTPKAYVTPNCHHYLVQNDTAYYYIFDGTVRSKATDKDIAAHWSLSYDKTDKYLATFAPELTTRYGIATGITLPTLADGSYYFINEDTVNTYGAYSFANLNAAGNWQVSYRKLTLTCTEHTLPFLDLGNVHGHELAIVEDVKVDRNLTDNYGAGTQESVTRNADKLFAFRTFINQIAPGDFDNADKVTVYEENKRHLSDVTIGKNGETTEHVIPYYSFSIERDGVEYFLNVDTIGGPVVYWTEILKTDPRYDILVNYQEENADSLRTFKFCLPYKVNEDGEKFNDGKDGKLEAVYLQTLDIARNDYPYLVIASAASVYTKAVRLNEALLLNSGNVLDWNIYTVDYTKVDYKSKATAWVFGKPYDSGKEWVPLIATTSEPNEYGIGSTVGYLNEYLYADGVIAESGSTNPLNFGIIKSINDAVALNFTYEGTAKIGKYIPRPIYYYKISIPNTDLYLTDGKDSVQYEFGAGNEFDYAFFGSKYDDFKGYADTLGIIADKDYRQTFGFKYVTDKNVVADAQNDTVHAFYVVSHADFTKPKAEQYRYLAEVNHHLVFVDNVKQALVFQFGHNDGKFTGIEKPAVNSGIYAVAGGVKVVGGTAGDKVDVYSIDGRLVKSTILNSTEQTISTPKGILIVKTAGKASKVIVK